MTGPVGRDIIPDRGRIDTADFASARCNAVAQRRVSGCHGRAHRRR